VHRGLLAYLMCMHELSCLLLAVLSTAVRTLCDTCNMAFAVHPFVCGMLGCRWAALSLSNSCVCMARSDGGVWSGYTVCNPVGVKPCRRQEAPPVGLGAILGTMLIS
jgi:hypothetical protein